MFSLSRAQWGMQGGDLWPLPKHKPLACSRHPDAKQGIKLQTELLKVDCRSGDDTQREADADLPLDSLGAAEKCILHKIIMYRANAQNAHPCATSLCWRPASNS